MSPSPYLQVALEAVKAAEIVINRYFQEEMSATLKADQSPVTIADQEAERIIRQHISEAFPMHSILGEEAGRECNDSTFLWAIDPIDGTKNYIRKVPLFATQVALLQDGEVILGVSNAPALGELIYAEKGGGAYFNHKRTYVSDVRTLDEAYMSFGGIGHFVKQGLLEPLLKLEKCTRAHRGFGDCWSYHLLAQGKIDIMLEARINVWDIAALSLIVEEAGGKVTDLNGAPVNEHTRSIIATNRHLHADVAGYLA